MADTELIIKAIPDNKGGVQEYHIMAKVEGEIVNDAAFSDKETLPPVLKVYLEEWFKYQEEEKLG